MRIENILGITFIKRSWLFPEYNPDTWHTGTDFRHIFNNIRDSALPAERMNSSIIRYQRTSGFLFNYNQKKD